MNTDIVKHILQKVESLCKERNLSESDLLKQAGLSSNVIDGWKEGKTDPSIGTLQQICGVLNVEIEDFFRNVQKLTDSQKSILNEWSKLSAKEKSALYDYIAAMKHKD